MGWDTQGGGEEIAGIADIARDRRDRKTNPGVESAKSLFFGVELGEGGYHWNRIIGEIGTRKPTAEGGCATRRSQTQRARKRNELATLAVRLSGAF